MDYEILLLSLAVDLVAIFVLTYAIYFPRHRRRDLTLGFVGVNVGLFAVASFVSARPVGLAFGIGLFALLSVIRLRSTQITQEEIGYYFVAIVVGLVNGLAPDDDWAVTITLTVVLVGVMYVVDHPWMLRRYQRRIVTLKVANRDDAEMRSFLEHKLGGEIVKLVVLELDYVNKRARVDVRFRPRPAGEPVPDEASVEGEAGAPDEPSPPVEDAVPASASVDAAPTAEPDPEAEVATAPADGPPESGSAGEDGEPTTPGGQG